MKHWRSASLRSDCRVSEAREWLKTSQERRQPVVSRALAFTHILHCGFRSRDRVLLYLTLLPNWILASHFDLTTCYVCPASVPVVFFFLIATVAILAHFPSTYVDLLFTLVSLYKQGCETGTWIILWPRCLPTVSTASLWLSLFPSEVWSANGGDKKEEQQQSRTGEIKISRYSNTTLWHRHLLSYARVYI